MNEELSNWYLARLRKLSWQDESSSQATPMTLVETDKSILQQMVLRSSDSQEQRRLKFQETIETSNAGDHSAKVLLLALFGALFIATLSFL